MSALMPVAWPAELFNPEKEIADMYQELAKAESNITAQGGPHFEWPNPRLATDFITIDEVTTDADTVRWREFIAKQQAEATQKLVDSATGKKGIATKIILGLLS